MGKKEGLNMQKEVLSKPASHPDLPFPTPVRNLRDMGERERSRVQVVWTFSVDILWLDTGYLSVPRSDVRN